LAKYRQVLMLMLYVRKLNQYWLSSATSLLAISFLFLAGCLENKGTEELADNSFGLLIYSVSGGDQFSDPVELFPDPIKVRVTDNKGTGVVGITVQFFQVTSLDAQVINGEVKTDENGYASTKIRAPGDVGATVKIRARINDSNVGTNFNLYTKVPTDGVKFTLKSTNDNSETAGVAFGFEVKILTLENTVSNYSGTMPLQWNFFTDSSWGNVAPTLMANVYNCNFVNGVCNVPALTTLTDASKITTVFMGDGDGGLADVFAHAITVNVNVASKMVIMDSLGGPGAGALSYFFWR